MQQGGSWKEGVGSGAQKWGTGPSTATIGSLYFSRKDREGTPLTVSIFSMMYPRRSLENGGVGNFTMKEKARKSFLGQGELVEVCDQQFKVKPASPEWFFLQDSQWGSSTEKGGR